jgi:hypothetical protein
MINVNALGRLIGSNAKRHSPIIYTALAGVGTLATAYLASRASFKAARLIDAAEAEGFNEDPTTRFLERTKLVWKCYIPTGFSAVSTIAFGVASNRIGARKIIATQSALTITQQAYSDYRTRAIEEFGDAKDQAIRAKIAEDQVSKHPSPSQEMLITGPGNVLCFEQYTGRYFTSDMETLRKSVNDVNSKLLAHDYVTLTDWYYMIGLEKTSHSSQLGWRTPKLMDLNFSAVFSDDGRPCIAFEYNYVGDV